MPARILGEAEQRYLAQTTSKKVTEVTSGLAGLRRWVKENRDHPHVIEVLRAMDRCATDSRSTVAASARDDLETLGLFGNTHALWKQAKAAKLVHAAAAFTPDAERAPDTPENLVRRYLARKEPAKLRAAIKAAKRGAAEMIVAELHGRADRDDSDAPTLVTAVLDACAHDDDGIRFAAIDLCAKVGRRARCDLSRHLPALVAASSVLGVPKAQGWGEWQTHGLADSARHALGAAVRWDASHARAVTVLRRALDSRDELAAMNAAYALAWGAARRKDWKLLREVLAGPASAVRFGSREALADTRDGKRVEVPATVLPPKERAVIVALRSGSPKKRREAQDRLVAIAAEPVAKQPAKRR